MDRAEAPVNVYEGGGQISVVVPIPGAHAEHTRIVVEPRRITVDAECKYEQEQQQYLRRDWQVGSWHADVDLPVGVDPTPAHASLNHGVLVVMAPVSDAASGRSTPPVS